MDGPHKPGAPKGNKGSTGQTPGGTEGNKGGNPTSLAKGDKGTSAGPNDQAKETPGAGEKTGPNGAGIGKTKGDKPAKPGQEQMPEPGQPGKGRGIGPTPPPPGEQPKGAGHPSDVSDNTVAKLFQPETTPPIGAKPTDQRGVAQGGSIEGAGAGSSPRLGKGGKALDVNDVDAIADPVEREAARKLQMAVQRIKANRDRRIVPNPSGRGDASKDGRRDW
jgi:hypothetical protein